MHDDESPREPPASDVDEGYTPDPDDDPALRTERALLDRARLLSAAFKVAVALVALSSIAWVLGVDGGRALTIGLVFGTLTALVNLALLAEGVWALFEGRVVAGLLFGGASFVLLLLVAFALLQFEPAWLFGYGIGLTLPAFAGVVVALAPRR